jgi:hypothetical protein
VLDRHFLAACQCHAQNQSASCSVNLATAERLALARGIDPKSQCLRKTNKKDREILTGIVSGNALHVSRFSLE